MTVYADIFFLINFVFDAQMLFILCKIYSKKVSGIKILLSAIVGGLAGVFAFVPYFEILLLPPAKVVLPAIMTAIVFLPCKKRMIAGATAIFAGISFMFSGAIIFFGLNIVSGLLIPLPVYAIICNFKKNVRKKRSLVKLLYKDKKSVEDGFYDSGNMLTSGGLPVILGSKAVFERLFGKGFSKKAIAEWVDNCDIRLVPYSSLGKKGAVIGVRLDYAEIGKKRYYGTVLAYAEEDFSDELILNSVMT